MVVMRICVPLLPVRALNDGGHAHLCALAPSALSVTNTHSARIIFRVGQNHIYTRCFWQGDHQIYGHIQCIYTILANPNHIAHR